MATPDSPLDRALQELVRLRVVPLSAGALERDTGAVMAAVRDEVIGQVPAYSESRQPELLGEMGAHTADHLAEILRLLAGGAVGPFEFVREQARLRAEKRFPLEALLHAYRCGHTVLSHWMRNLIAGTRQGRRPEAVAAIADLATEYTNAISAAVTAAYVDHTRMLAEREGDERTRLLQVLLGGHDESDGRVSQLLRRAGYLDDRLVFCVALAHSADPHEMENAARAQRIVEAMSRALRAISVKTLAGIREHLVVVVLADVRRLSGWTAPRSSLADRVRPCLDVLGPSVLIGVSNDQPSTASIPRALHEAGVALDFTGVTQRIVQFSELSIRRLLLHRASDYAQSAMPGWMSRFAAADRGAGGALFATLRALADADLNVQQAARTLRLHPNTLYARLVRINDLTGLDARRYHDLTEMLLAVECTAATSGSKPS